MLEYSGSPIVVFVGVVFMSGVLGFSGWLLGEDMKGLCLFLLVSGSLMTVFGFLLCLIPWELGVGSGSSGGGAFIFVVSLCGSLVMAVEGKSTGIESFSVMGSGGLSWEVCALMGVLLFLVMVLVVSFAPLKSGALRRCFWSVGECT
uniref:NADH dehydrogenase subunit 6 n=1 Tax=Pinctada maxima TaxID=104660 RepID=J9PBZ8_PINMA|nr:NADH dehydrogenase subunit 6 [Pinctada maxima]